MGFSLQMLTALCTMSLLQLVQGMAVVQGNPSIMPDRYIITLKSNADMGQHLDFVRAVHTELESNEAKIQKLLFKGLTHEYSIPGFKAYAGHFSKPSIDKILATKEIERIDHDQMMSIAAVVTQKEASASLGLISHRGLSQDHKGYPYDATAGFGTYAYVIDTGIDVDHKDFEGRAYNAHLLRKKAGFTDTNGHGTKVAGIIGSKTFGVAKKCKILSVKVMEEPKGPLSDVMLGYDWSVKDILAHKRKGRSVINVSITGPANPSFNRMINSATGLGITTVAAAGNDGADVAKSSPGSCPNAITVAATDLHRVRASDSNYGAGISLFAPGVDVMTCAPGGGTGPASGTSMAAAHVTGLALYIAGMKQHMLDPRSLKTLLMKLATPKVVGDIKGSPNLFAYNNGGSSVGIP